MPYWAPFGSPAEMHHYLELERRQREAAMLAAERARWAALTPEQQEAERRAARQRQQEAEARAAAEAARARQQAEQAEKARRAHAMKVEAHEARHGGRDALDKQHADLSKAINKIPYARPVQFGGFVAAVFGGLLLFLPLVAYLNMVVLEAGGTHSGPDFRIVLPLAVGLAVGTWLAKALVRATRRNKLARLYAELAAVQRRMGCGYEGCEMCQRTLGAYRTQTRLPPSGMIAYS
jgi:hypothetical protein